MFRVSRVVTKQELFLFNKRSFLQLSSLALKFLAGKLRIAPSSQSSDKFLKGTVGKWHAVFEFNEFESRLKSGKNRFLLSAGLDLEKLNSLKKSSKCTFHVNYYKLYAVHYNNTVQYGP